MHALHQYSKDIIFTQDVRHHAMQFQSSKNEVETSGDEGVQVAREITFLTDDRVRVRSP